MVGVNRFRMDETAQIPTFTVDYGVEKAQIERIKETRMSRDQAETTRALDLLEQAARGSANLMPYIFDAAGALATLGEISDRLRAVFGEYQIA